jgi:hypothetical protein
MKPTSLRFGGGAKVALLTLGLAAHPARAVDLLQGYRTTILMTIAEQSKQ